jgi:hypothetical protein
MVRTSKLDIFVDDFFQAEMGNETVHGKATQFVCKKVFVSFFIKICQSK